MSKIRAVWLWVCIGVEVVAIAVIISWALAHPHKATAPSATTTPQGTAATASPKVTPVAFAHGLTAPTSIAATGVTGDDTLFVTEQKGTIRPVDNQGKVGGPMLDITSKVLDQGEMGLLGIAFHPKLKMTSSYVYLDYVNRQQQTIVARYSFDVATNTIKPESEKVLLTLQQVFPNHKGGQLQFGPDGYLYIGIGDGGSAGDPNAHGQDTGTWFGKILRIDVDHGDPYVIPKDNPFANSKTAKPEIWAYGLRNPWRFSFDSINGDLYIADVGQNAYEEVDVQHAGSKGGQNYGWRCYEATHSYNTANCQTASNFVMPVLEYNHDNKRCSITGGYVYHGRLQPAFVGKYFYADYCTGDIFYTHKQNTTPWQQTLAAATGNNISTFGQSNDGELYYADVANGDIYHLTDTANK